jgi:hypothetical protein
VAKVYGANFSIEWLKYRFVDLELIEEMNLPLVLLPLKCDLVS